ncbi:hypothetical protein SAMN04488134_11378 [Amphibacillus marinus]|uniref:Uncharacterized protein n=1 Tax=Amphibacillus marinus TaxID=872970 RepID=A0A1H8SR24_9BACI|nr:hypothetical protein SAMN04488134_11378 [Amphibacillus marinus]
MVIINDKEGLRLVLAIFMYIASLALGVFFIYFLIKVLVLMQGKKEALEDIALQLRELRKQNQ